ncbi:MAG: ribbon-helix-helix protein, CopG family [Halobacteriaceae archaeon]
MGTTRVNFRLPEDLVERADAVAEATHKDRTAVVVEALRAYLADVADDETIREAVVERYLDDQVGFDVLREFVGRQDAEAVRASKELLDDGESVARDLADQ